MNLVYFQEKAELENVVAVHVAHILTYQQVRDPKSGQYVYKMDPDVESIVCYPGTKRLINITYGIKQMIALEVGANLQTCLNFFSYLIVLLPEFSSSQDTVCTM